MAVAIEADADLRRMLGYSGPDQPDDELLKQCVHCGMCLSSCPTYRITGQEMSSPRGRLWMMRAVGEGRLDLLDPAFDEQMYQCLNCRACEAVCPSGVQYGPLVESARSQLEQHRPRPVWQRVTRKVGVGWLFNEASRMRALVGTVALYQKTGMQAVVRRTGVLKLLRMQELEAMLPKVSRRPLRPATESWSPAQPKQDVALFNTCMMGTVFADTNRAAGRVLAHNGCSCFLPAGQQCCGALAVHAGMMDEARDLARRNIDAFGEGDTPIAVTAAGCGAALKEYGHLLHDDPDYADRATAFSARVRDITELLAGLPEVVPPTHRVEATVTYQEPCHLVHAQRISRQPRELLAAVPGLQLREMRESSLCCGSAGIYNLLRPQMANELGDRKAGNAAATGAETLVTANPGCAMQMVASLRRNGTNMDVRHIMDVLDEAYGGEATAAAGRWACEAGAVAPV
ncbi:MAG TPA: heterodisulfide reductase-related iron-sulfur binding cluster [Thermomicrobiales bacterium]|jgi:glycolate oxidase iron-sulfur subunit|nr:heterodisulfide reductase-related iron-sulfur binding cluster [Thermomicrobiales bacterium]